MVKKCNSKSTVTTFFPPHIFSGIYLNIQLMKTRRGCNFNSNGNSVSIQSHLNYDLLLFFQRACLKRFHFFFVLKIKEKDKQLKVWKFHACCFFCTLRTSKVFNMRLYLYKAKLQNHSKAFLINCCQSCDLQRQ